MPSRHCFRQGSRRCARPGVIDITAQGRARLGGIVTRARAFEVEKLAGIPAADVAALRRALTALGKEGE